MPKVSIIIPVYNASQYLAECLDSIIAQTFEDIEIICINDGSTDDSLEILKQYQIKDARILIIDQKNQGVSAARNAGLAIAKGAYNGFVDSDDAIENDFYEKLFKAAVSNKVDLVFSKTFFGGGELVNGKIYSKEEILEIILPLYFKEDGHNAIWNKLYSAEIIRQYEIHFPVGKTHGEDAEFNIHFLMKTGQLYVLDYSGYHYRETEGSATRNASKYNYLQQAVETFQKDWTDIIGETIAPSLMHQLKKERLINNIIAQVYIYSNPENGLSLKSRLGSLSQIVHHDLVQKLFHENNEEITTSFHRYKKEIYKGIQSQSVIRLYLLSLYSYYQNQ